MGDDLDQRLHVEPYRSNAWMLSFVDTLSILITFFILVYATSSNVTLVEGEGNSSSKHNIDTYATNTDSNYLYELIKKDLEGHHLHKNVLINENKDDIVMSFASDDLFLPYSDKFKPSSIKLLDFIEDTLANLDNIILINGINSWDNFSVKKQNSDNFKLPLARAVALARKISLSGYDFEIGTFGFVGSDYKLDGNQANTSFLQRMDIVIKNQKAESQNPEDSSY